MMDRIIRYFKDDKSGKIRLTVAVEKGEELSFRIDARSMQVEWGDHQQSQVGQLTEQFAHQYQNQGVYDIDIQGEEITGIDMPGCHCTDLKVEECETLEYINCSHNQLLRLDIRRCKALYELECRNNCLEELLLDKYSNLFYISCSSNRLHQLDLQGCRNLVNLYCNHNFLRELDVRNCPKLVTLNIEDNAFTTESLLAFVATLKVKPKGTTGLIGIGKKDISSLQEVRNRMNEKGWYEI